MDRVGLRLPSRITVAVLVASTVLAGPVGQTGAVDGPTTPETGRAVVFDPAALELEVGERRAVVVFTCRGRDRGADQRPGTDDDECEPGRAATLDLPPNLTSRARGRGGSRWRIVSRGPGAGIVTATVADAEAGELPVVVHPPVPRDDRAAIGTRARGSGDVDRDGAITDADVRVLGDLLASAPGRVIPADDPAVPPSANVLGGAFITDADVAELERRVRRERRLARVAEQARIDLTPNDIVPLHARDVGIVATVIDASARTPLAGTFGVSLVGGDRRYYDGPGRWVGAGEVPVTNVYEGPSFLVFTVPAPGFGFVGHQRPGEDDTRTVAFEAIEPDIELALPAPGGRLTVPLDVDRDTDVDWDDHAAMLVSVGMRAGDRGFPARGDVVADGVITLDDIAAFAAAVGLVGPGPVGGAPGSGDLDGDGDLDARDVRGALAHLGADRTTARRIVTAELDGADELLARADAVEHPAALDLDGDGSFGPADVAAMAAMAGVRLGELGPYYLGLEDADVVAVPPGDARLDVDGDGRLGPTDAAAVLEVVDAAIAGAAIDADVLARSDLDGDGSVTIDDLAPLRAAITPSPDEG